MIVSKSVVCWPLISRIVQLKIWQISKKRVIETERICFKNKRYTFDNQLIKILRQITQILSSSNEQQSQVPT